MDRSASVSGVDVRFLGTGDAFGSGGRLHTATLLQSEAGVILVDCGPSTLAALRGQGLEPAEIDAIVLTHLHGDHFAGVPFLLMDAHYATGRRRPLVVAGPPGLEDTMARAHDVLFRGSGVLPFRFPLSWIELAERAPVQAGPCRVTGVPVAHSEATPCFGLRVALAGRVVAFSGDTEWADSLIELAADADLFVCECVGFDSAPPHHLDYRVLQAHRDALTCRRMLLTHMGDDMLRRAAEVEIETAHDGLMVSL
jgi:ribonuclease BN (tRNA processing enzyme)